ncbi:hypothetical protein HU200_035186 [Digitaria exilis]|uniref:Uncharacterized protein n=1 Tax=Digitaria exilis TaxID=1010633 RepID=A0A835ELZ0_9POAL|nr:hypothetical protein HU200_035186 [Digitaria exilis]
MFSSLSLPSIHLTSHLGTRLSPVPRTQALIRGVEKAAAAAVHEGGAAREGGGGTIVPHGHARDPHERIGSRLRTHEASGLGSARLREDSTPEHAAVSPPRTQTPHNDELLLSFPKRYRNLFPNPSNSLMELAKWQPNPPAGFKHKASSFSLRPSLHNSSLIMSSFSTCLS